MKPAALCFLGAILACSSGRAQSAERSRANLPHEPALATLRVSQGEPVLLELFESEGCSSCPPAEVVLEDLMKPGALPGVDLIALSFHVDYWDKLGWKDPFSDARFTDRQRCYGKGGSIYTPQAVVDGVQEVVGSRKSKLQELVLAARTKKKARPQIDVTCGPGAIDVEVDRTEPDSERFLFVTQDEATVAVARGENAGQTLHHVAIVRTMTSAISRRTHILLPDGLRASRSRVVYVEQRRDTNAVVALSYASCAP